MVQGYAYRMVEPGQPLAKQDVDFITDQVNDSLVRVIGCGICHTDIGFLHDGVRTRKPPPIALGHEIVGEVLEGPAAGRSVVVPAVLPCGECRACKAGRPGTCARQKMPGNDIDGGFASHVVVPGRHLQPIPDGGKLETWQYAAAADAGSTAWAAVTRCRVSKGDTAVVIGAGGVGGFAAQIGRYLGANVLALDVDESRLDSLSRNAGIEVLSVEGMSPRDIRNAVSSRLGKDRWGWRILECSGTPAGQEAAFTLLGHAGVMGVIGYTPKKITLRLSNVMAFEADLVGSWGCPPDLYAPVIQAMADGGVVVPPFVERHPMEEVNEVLELVHNHAIERRPVMVT